MEVSKPAELVQNTEVLAESLAENLEGENLLQTLVSLTGLPENFANQELNQILESTGTSSQDRAEMTLEDLRAALISYLESLDPGAPGDPAEMD